MLGKEGACPRQWGQHSSVPRWGCSRVVQQPLSPPLFLCGPWNAIGAPQKIFTEETAPDKSPPPHLGPPLSLLVTHNTLASDIYRTIYIFPSLSLLLPPSLSLSSRLLCFRALSLIHLWALVDRLSISLPKPASHNSIPVLFTD